MVEKPWRLDKRGGIIIELRKQLIRERKRLEEIREKVGQRLNNVPEGTLRLSKSQGCVQYYHCKKGSPHNGTYIHKKDIELENNWRKNHMTKRYLIILGK